MAVTKTGVVLTCGLTVAVGLLPVAGAGSWNSLSPIGGLTRDAKADVVCGALVERFDTALAKQWPERGDGSAPAAPLTNDSGAIAWGTSYLLTGLAEMIAATGNPRYVQRFLELADRVLAARDDHQGLRDELRGRITRAWSSTRYSNGKRTVWAVHTGMIAAPMARFAAAVRERAALAQAFDARATELLDAARAAVAEHDAQYRDGPGPGEGHLVGVSLEGPLPLNQQNALARAWIWIDRAQGTDRHRERIARLARTLVHRMERIEQGALRWSYWPDRPGATEGDEDISHAAINVDFAVLCREQGIVVSDDVLTGLEHTLLDQVFLPGGHVANTVGGSLDRRGGQDRYASAVFRWARLAGHSESVRRCLTELALRGPRDSLTNLVGHALLRAVWGRCRDRSRGAGR